MRELSDTAEMAVRGPAMEKGLRKRCLLLLLLLFASSSTTLLLFKEAAPELCHIVAKSDLEMHFALHEERGHIQFIF